MDSGDGTDPAVLRVVEQLIGPLIDADSGELYMVEHGKQRLWLHLAGRYAGCPGNTLAARRVIEPALYAVAPALEITITAGIILPPGSKRVSAALRGDQD